MNLIKPANVISFLILSLTASFLLIAPPTAMAGLIFGPSARVAFDDYLNNFGGTHVDFESVSGGLTTQIPGVTFGSTRSTSGTPIGPFPVQVSSSFNSSHGNTIVGRPCASCGDDGRVGYDINFDSPQRWAGVERIWNPQTLTTFFNASGAMLGQHSNTVNTEFVAFLANSSDPVDWISRIAIDTIAPSSSRQVGYSDDLIFGISAVPEPGCMGMLLVGLTSLGLMRRRSSHSLAAMC